MNDKTAFIRALRPFSLVVAIATCGLGVSLALIEGSDQYPLALLVISTGLLLQVAVNLINDYRDIESHRFSPGQQAAIKRNTRIGWGLMCIAIAAGIYMVSIRGWILFALGLVGVVGAWGYTGGEINFKSRGLGVVLVFFLMGVLLIGGSYYTVSGNYHADIFLLSLPFSLLSSLLLLSNELRDYEEDLAAGIKTLSVRLGYDLGVRLFYWIVALVYFISALLFQAGILNHFTLIALTLLVLWQPLKLLHAPKPQRSLLTRSTGRFYLFFSLCFLASLWLTHQ